MPEPEVVYDIDTNKDYEKLDLDRLKLGDTVVLKYKHIFAKFYLCEVEGFYENAIIARCKMYCETTNGDNKYIPCNENSRIGKTIEFERKNIYNVFYKNT